MTAVRPDENGNVVRLSFDDAMQLALTSLAKIGYEGANAKIIADHIIDSALCGYRMIAFPRILQMGEHTRRYPDHGPVHVERLTPVSARVHGNNETGYLTDFAAAHTAVEICREHRF